MKPPVCAIWVQLIAAPELQAWFVRDVLPLEAMLRQFLRRSVRNQSNIDDLVQDVYVRVCEAANREIPNPVKPFVFTIARNILIDRVRREHVVSIEAVEDLDALNIAIDAPGPEQSVIAREELRRVQAALDRLPPRAREAVILRKVDDLSWREIAERMGNSGRGNGRPTHQGRHACPCIDALRRSDRPQEWVMMEEDCGQVAPDATTAAAEECALEWLVGRERGNWCQSDQAELDAWLAESWVNTDPPIGGWMQPGAEPTVCKLQEERVGESCAPSYSRQADFKICGRLGNSFDFRLGIAGLALTHRTRRRTRSSTRRK